MRRDEAVDTAARELDRVMRNITDDTFRRMLQCGHTPAEIDDFISEQWRQYREWRPTGLAQVRAMIEGGPGEAVDDVAN
jgi:hypothetical protein